MSSPRTSPKLNQESTTDNYDFCISNYGFSMFDVQRDDQLKLAKSWKNTMGKLLLKLDENIEMVNQIELYSIMLEPENLIEYELNPNIVTDILSKKIDDAMKPLVTHFLQDESNSKRVKEKYEDIMYALKAKFIAPVFINAIDILLQHANEFASYDIEKLKKSRVEILDDIKKPDDDYLKKVLDDLFALNYKNQDTKRSVLAIFSDYYMPIYCGFLNFCNKLEQFQEEYHHKGLKL